MGHARAVTGAEVLPLSIGPADSGLAGPSGRVREALAVADGVERGGRRPARREGRVFRRARAELIGAGLVKPTAALAAVAAAASIDLYSEARVAAVDLGGGKTGGPSEIEAYLGSQH